LDLVAWTLGEIDQRRDLEPSLESTTDDQRLAEAGIQFTPTLDGHDMILGRTGSNGKTTR